MYCVSCRSRGDDGGLWGAPGHRSFWIGNQEVKPQQFVSSLLSNLRQGTPESPPRLVCFVHGYNVVHEGALRAARHIDAATQQVAAGSTTVAFSWPAEGRVAAYLDDRCEARWAAEHLAGLIRETVRMMEDERCFAQLVLVCHSMGAYLTAHTAWAAAEAIGFGRHNVFSEVILLAPDLDAEALEPGRIGEHIPNFARRVTVYHSRKDGVLLASSAKRAGVTGARLGRQGPARHDRLPDNVVIVDTTEHIAGHSAYFTDPHVLADLVATMKGTDRELIGGRTADPKVGPRFWRLLTSTEAA